MRYIPALALLGVLGLSGPALAQGYYDYDANAGAYAQDPGSLVSFWYQKYLSRVVDPSGLAGWTQQLMRSAPASVLASILSSQEYYARAGCTPDGFVRTLFMDVLGRQPTPQEYNWAMGHFVFGASSRERTRIARDLLNRYPQAIFPSFAAAPAPPPGYRPEHEWRERYWHEHEYRRPDWRYRP
jgi:hypothetical protein